MDANGYAHERGQRTRDFHISFARRYIGSAVKSLGADSHSVAITALAAAANASGPVTMPLSKGNAYRAEITFGDRASRRSYRATTDSTTARASPNLAGSPVAPIVEPNAAVPDQIGLDPIIVCGIGFG